MGFKSGEEWNGNATGRKPGSRNKRTEELFSRLEARGDKDPADFLSAVVSNEQEPKELRVQAANMLLPYKYSKTQPSPALVYVEQEVQLPHPSPRTITQSNENILYLSGLKATGQIDLEWGNNLINDQRIVRDGLIDDAKIIASGQDYRDQTIHITGGLPTMPGLEGLIMPQINGHTIESVQAIDHQPSESVPNNTTSEDPKP
jgi:hypothetical protein